MMMKKKSLKDGAEQKYFDEDEERKKVEKFSDS
jgi:hypothetical protein